MMKDLRENWAHLKAQALEYGRLRDCATNESVRDFYDRLALHFGVLASQLDGGITSEKKS